MLGGTSFFAWIILNFFPTPGEGVALWLQSILLSHELPFHELFTFSCPCILFILCTSVDSYPGRLWLIFLFFSYFLPKVSSFIPKADFFVSLISLCHDCNEC